MLADPSPARYRPLYENVNTATIRKRSWDATTPLHVVEKIYLRVVDIAHPGWILLGENIVIPAVVLRNKFCEPKCEGIGEKYDTVRISYKNTPIFRDNTKITYVSLPMGRAWISTTRMVENIATRCEISIAKHSLPRYFSLCYLLDLITSHKNLTAKTDCWRLRARDILRAHLMPMPCPSHVVSTSPRNTRETLIRAQNSNIKNNKIITGWHISKGYSE